MEGLAPEIPVNNSGRYFLDIMQAEEKRRVMRIVQEGFRNEARALAIPACLAADGESILSEAFQSGHAAMVPPAGVFTGRDRLRAAILIPGGSPRGVP